MRIGKNILLFIFILIISLNVTVYAQENGEKTENPVKVTQESENDKDVPFTNSKGETVYTLSAITRDREGAIMMPKDRILCLTSEIVDLSDIEVLIDDSNEQAQKDLEVEVISASKNTAKICVNFSNRYVSTNLNWDGKILVKKGNDVIREIAIAYMTPYIRDVHDTGFQTLSAWSGTLGGAIIKDKLFYFVSAEAKKEAYPSSVYPGYTDNYMTPEVAKQIADKYQQYTGFQESYSARDVENKSFGLLARIDWNINKDHKLAVRYQHNNSFDDKQQILS